MFEQSPLSLIAILFVTVVFISCKGNTGPEDTDKPSLPLKVKKVIPESGTVGDTVIIKGQGFASQSSSTAITFNGAKADVMFASKHQLSTTVPDSATDGPLKVSKGQQTVTGPEFNVVDLGITNIIPQRATVGDTIKITGKGFSWNPSKNTVFFAGEAKGNVVTVGDGYIEVVVPDSATTGQVEVSVGLQKAMIPNFTVHVTPLTIASFKVSSGDKRIRNIEPVQFSWRIKGKGSSGDLTCKLDADGDGTADYTIDTCSKGGGQSWLYRKKNQVQHYQPKLIVTSGDKTVSKPLAGDATIAPKKPYEAKAAIKATYNNAVALKSDGHMVAWGKNQDKNSSLPDSIQGNVRTIAEGGDFTLYIENDGDIGGVGKDDKGQISPPNKFKTVKNAVDIDAGSNTTVGLKENGEIFGFGRLKTIGGIPKGLGKVTSLTVGPKYVLALKADGSVISWYGSKSNRVGQADVPKGLDEVVAVDASFDYCWKCGFYNMQFSLALKKNGTVVGWGGNSNGQSDVPQDLTNVVQIAAGGRNAIALKADGTVVAWGKYSDVPKGLKHVVSIAAGRGFNVALKADGSTVAWGKKYGMPPKQLDLLP